jgi:hypothetical protein
MRLWLRWPAWLCLSLVFWMAAAESTHNHPNPVKAASCSICVAAQSSSPTASSSHTQPVFATVSVLRDEEVLSKAEFDASSLGIRGPPAIL